MVNSVDVRGGQAGEMIPPGRLHERASEGESSHPPMDNGSLTHAGSLVALNDEDLAMTIIRGFNDAFGFRRYILKMGEFCAS